MAESSGEWGRLTTAFSANCENWHVTQNTQIEAFDVFEEISLRERGKGGGEKGGAGSVSVLRRKSGGGGCGSERLLLRSPSLLHLQSQVSLYSLFQTLAFVPLSLT
nr:hypothetical protein Iba_chr13bCG6380 [Ipomoea batatas]